MRMLALYVCMYLCMYICVYLLYTHVYCVCVCVRVCVRVCVCVCVCLCMYHSPAKTWRAAVCMRMSALSISELHTHTHTHTHMNMCVCIYIRLYARPSMIRLAILPTFEDFLLPGVLLNCDSKARKTATLKYQRLLFCPILRTHI